MEELISTISHLDWSPLWITLESGAAATVLSFFLGLWAARRAMSATPRWKAVLDGLLTLPMVLPPRWRAFSCC